MDQELQKLIHQLRDQKCPPRVMERVAQRISREKTAARSWPFSLGWAACLTCLLGALALRQWQTRQRAQLLSAELAAAQSRAQRTLVVEQTQQAFGYIGLALISAAAHTENALLKEAFPPLRNGFEIAKTKVAKAI